MCPEYKSHLWEKKEGLFGGGGGDQGPFDSVSLELEGREAYRVSPPPTTRLPREQKKDIKCL